ncbi:site-2 protease family protein [Halosimplex salinum]|uniref:site-2 protease family protein n=1 Tax=Halosimplex salinum TaxID=1710538 RepID=UPI000F482399|nr:site-2 protease family protein [Halosimplex salinum]
MVRPLYWVLAGIAVYTAGAMALQARGKLPESVRVSGPITTLHTGRGREFLTRLAAPKRFWRAWGNLGVGMALVTMVGMFAAIFNAGLQAMQQPERQPVQNPQNVLVIPGVNDFLPPAAAPEIVLGLLIGLVVHEGGHGLLCRVENIDIDSMGLAFFAFIPVGAFVEPDEESRLKASRGSQTRMFAAGVTNNFLVAFVGFLILFGPVSGSIAVAAGVPVGNVAEESAAQEAGLGYGDLVTEVEGQPIANVTEFEAALADIEDREVELTLKSGETTTLERKLMLMRSVPSVIDGIEPNPDDPTFVEAINGTDVYTERGFARAMSDRETATIRTNRGNATFPVGAYGLAVENGPLANASVPTDGTDVIVTHVDGERTPNASAYSSVVRGLEDGSTVDVRATVGGEPDTYSVTVGSGADRGDALGLRTQQGYSGIGVVDTGIDVYPAAQFLSYLGGFSGPWGGLFSGQFLQQMFVVLLVPFLSTIAPSIGYNFAGFVPDVANFYTVTGPLSALGGGVFMIANVLFWTAWVNLNLGVFNCVPTFPLDGGHILRSSAESVVARLPIEDGRRATTAVTASISLLMLAGLFLMLFGPQLFG